MLITAPTILALAHLMPSRPTWLSRVGENSFMCLLLTWSGMLLSTWVGYQPRWQNVRLWAMSWASGGVGGGTGAYEHAGLFSPANVLFTAITFALVLAYQVATSISFARASPFRKLPVPPGLRTARIPYPVYPAPTVAGAAWLLLLYFGIAGIRPDYHG